MSTPNWKRRLKGIWYHGIRVALAVLVLVVAFSWAVSCYEVFTT